MPLPPVELTHATQVARPFHREGWVYEEKVDGYRMVAYKDGPRVRLISRQGKDHTAKFRDVTYALQRLSVPTLILDGGRDRRLRPSTHLAV
jgi:bifunctional non-homologous end joining protein LigD